MLPTFAGAYARSTLVFLTPGKQGFPNIAYEVTVDHSGRALAVTEGFTGATNDTTAIRYDTAFRMIRESTETGC